MARRRTTVRTEVRELQMGDIVHPVRIHTELRGNARVSVTTNAVHIRLPIGLTGRRREAQIGTFLDWARDAIERRPDILHRPHRTYASGDVLDLFDGPRTLHIEQTEGRQRFHAADGVIDLRLSSTDQDTIRAGVIRVLRRLYAAPIEQRVRQLNDRHEFGRVQRVRLKDNRSNWGSCSVKGNINLSLRLLLSPPAVIDYVIIHELAHLRHPDHSRNFWRTVEAACPAYRRHEDWLREHGRTRCVL